MGGSVPTLISTPYCRFARRSMRPMAALTSSGVILVYCCWRSAPQTSASDSAPAPAAWAAWAMARRPPKSAATAASEAGELEEDTTRESRTAGCHPGVRRHQRPLLCARMRASAALTSSRLIRREIPRGEGAGGLGSRGLRGRRGAGQPPLHRRAAPAIRPGSRFVRKSRRLRSGPSPGAVRGSGISASLSVQRVAPRSSAPVRISPKAGAARSGPWAAGSARTA